MDFLQRNAVNLRLGRCQFPEAVHRSFLNRRAQRRSFDQRGDILQPAMLVFVEMGHVEILSADAVFGDPLQSQFGEMNRKFRQTLL